MSRNRPKASVLRAEARILTIAGALSLAVGFPLTLAMVAWSLADGGVSPLAPLATGAPLVMLGYLACHFASLRMAKAKALAARKGRAASRSPAAARRSAGSRKSELLTESVY